MEEPSEPAQSKVYTYYPSGKEGNAFFEDHTTSLVAKSIEMLDID